MDLAGRTCTRKIDSQTWLRAPVPLCRLWSANQTHIGHDGVPRCSPAKRPIWACIRLNGSLFASHVFQRTNTPGWALKGPDVLGMRPVRLGSTTPRGGPGWKKVKKWSLRKTIYILYYIIYIYLDIFGPSEVHKIPAIRYPQRTIPLSLCLFRRVDWSQWKQVKTGRFLVEVTHN